MSIESVFEQMWRGRRVGPAFVVAAASDIVIGIGLGVAAVAGTDDTTTALILAVVALVLVAFGTLMTVAVLRLMKRQAPVGSDRSTLVTMGDDPAT